ncbi:MAG: hypothetical protein LBQ89_04605 [Treponema sp.]|nr:hypothetical protein [Treponema sp.]
MKSSIRKEAASRFGIILFFIFFGISDQVFPAGRADIREETKTQNNEWVLCITNFDTSSLAENRITVTDIIMKKFVENLSTINYRTRISPEYAYYEEIAWVRARSEAARALAAKQNERSSLVYRGDPEWIYLRNIEKIDTDIEKLMVVLEEVENNAPSVNTEPVFRLTADNMEFNFPAAPIAGNENRFCLDRNIDALLEGSIADFYGRFIVSLKLYTLYTRSFVWEDSVVFSHGDLENALAEITRRLLVVLSGNESSVLTVRAEPEETLVLINTSFAGRGEISNLEYPPGEITITASAPDHESLTFNTELFPGEFTEIDINLRHLEYGNLEIAGHPSGSVYQGALYIGEAPLTLRLPLNQMEYIELVTSDNARSTILFKMPQESEFNNSLVLQPVISPAQGRVDRTRRLFYWAWGGTWITGIAAWVTYHTFYNSNMAGSYNYANTGVLDQKLYDDNMRLYYISMGSIIAVGVATVFDIILMGRYIYTANKGSIPVTGTGRN